jgi:hypothetical protein
MPTATYIALANITLGSSVGNVSFSSIPATYRDLVLVAGVKHTTSNGGYIGYRLNSDSGGNYSSAYMLGDGSSAFSATTSGESFGRFGNASTTNFDNVIFNLCDYSATDRHKTTLSRTNVATSYAVAYANRWTNTSAVTSIQLFPDSGSFATGSTFALYGIVS